MKREGIRRRQKIFLTFLLAVIIGFLPTVEVLASTYSITRTGSGSAGDNYYLNVSLNGNSFLQGAGYTTGSNGKLFLYGVPGDEIRLVNNFNANITLTFLNTKNVACTLNAGKTDPVFATDGTQLKLTLPGAETYSDFAGTDYGWRIEVTDGSGYNISAVSCQMINTVNIKYYDTDGTDISTLVDNKQIYVPIVSNHTPPVVYDVLLLPYNKTGKNFDGWYTAPTGGTKVTDIISYYDANTNTSKVGCNMDSDRLPTGNLVQDTGVYKLYGRWSGGGFTPTPGGDEPEPDPDIITYYPDNILNLPEEEEIYESEISLPENIFRANPGQMFEGWQVADTEQDPIVGTGEIYKPGTVFQVKDGMAFIAVWKDNPTFKIECDEEYILTPPDNTINNLTSLIRMSSEITYYEDGEEPEQEDTEKEKKTYIKGTAIPSSQLEVVIDDPKAIRKVGTFPAKIVYKGLYERTLEKTVSVTVLDPNDPTFASFDITDIEELGKVTVTYPDSIACHGSKWKQAKSYVSIACDAMSITTKKVKTSDFEEVKAGQSGEIIKIKGKISKNDDLNKEEARKLSKKLNKKIKKQLPKTITIRPLIVMPEMFAGASVRDGELKSVSIVLEDKTKVIIKPDDFTVDEEKQVVNFSGNYGGNLTFEELELASAPAK